MQTKIDKLAIIAGKGGYPQEVISCCEKDNINFIVIGIIDHNAKENSKIHKNYELSLGEVTKLLNILADEKVSHIIFAGAVNKPNFQDLKVDFAGTILLAKILKSNLLGDNNILSSIVDFFEKKGYKVIGTADISPHILSGAGKLGKLAPSKSNMQDITIAHQTAKIIGALDIGQAIIVDNKVVLAVEAVEGTDEMIRRAAALKKSKTKSGVLLKVAKPDQDRRVDLPTVGTRTVELVASANFAGIAVSADESIIIDRDETIKLANQKGIFIYGI